MYSLRVMFAIRERRVCTAGEIASALLAWGSATVHAQTIRFRPVPREVIETRLEQYSGSDADREQSLKRLFGEAGCGDHISEQKVTKSRQPNLICTLPGSSGKVIIVGAHYDHVKEGDGVVDNWSGASLLPSLYQAIEKPARRHTFIFIGFTDEEKGLVGSQYYVRKMTRAEIAATDGMVNLDTLGLGPTEVWVSHSDAVMAGAAFYIGRQLGVPVTGANVDQVGTSDGESFARRKILRTTIHSLTQESYDAGILHTRKDMLSAIRLGDYYQTYRLLSAYLALLDSTLGAPDRAGEP
jgi:hypothetical protein